MSWRNLSLSDKERIGFILPKDHRKGEFDIVTKVLSSRFHQNEAMGRTFKQLWQSNNGLRICKQGNNIVLFVFDNLADVDKILKEPILEF